MYNAGVLLSAESLARAGNCVYFYVFDFWNPDGFGPVGSIVPFKGFRFQSFPFSNFLKCFRCCTLQ